MREGEHLRDLDWYAEDLGAARSVACDFRRTSFFDATFEGCKLIGSVFSDCVMRPMKVVGGQWRGVTIRGTNLSKLDLAGAVLLAELHGAAVDLAR